LAPKLYALELGPKDGSQEPGPQFESFRAKGIQMTLENQSRLGFDTILPLIRRTIEDKTAEHTINVKNFNIFTNSTNNALPFGNLFSRYNTKKVRVIITKRTIEEVDEVNFETLGEINTFPPGYGE
jgi:3-dehydroquinate synthase class II